MDAETKQKLKVAGKLMIVLLVLLFFTIELLLNLIEKNKRQEKEANKTEINIKNDVDTKK